MEVILVVVSVINLVAGLKCQSSMDESRTRWTVDCSTMNLSSAPPPVILHPVAVLNMSHNVFTQVTESQFINWTDISHLDLSFNSIQLIKNDSFNGLSKLTELNLMNNYLEVLSPNITNHLPKLRILNLSSNKLKTITTETFQPVPLLLKLFLGGNSELGKLSDNYNALSVPLAQSLITLDLTNTTLSDFPSNFFINASHLITLKIAQNPLKKIPDLPPSLRHLNMSRTLMETVPQGVFLKSDLLQRLSLEGMPLLRDIKANAFSGLVNLEELYLRDCPLLSFMSADVFGTSTPKLQRMDVAHCSLSTLPKTFKELLSKVEYLDLQGNPWVCDGRISWILNVNIQPSLAENLRCDSPPPARGMLVAEFFKPRNPHPYYNLIRAGLVIAMVAILVASVIGMIRHLSKEKVKTYRQLQDLRLQERSPTVLPPL